MGRPAGATVAEIVAMLAKRFPEREPKASTAYANARVYADKKTKDADGSTRFFGAGKGRR